MPDEEEELRHGLLATSEQAPSSTERGTHADLQGAAILAGNETCIALGSETKCTYHL